MPRKSKYAESYKNAYRRYRNRILSLERKGYVIPAKYYINKTKPSKAAIAKLEAITFKNIKSNLSRVDVETGEIIPLKQAQKVSKVKPVKQAGGSKEQRQTPLLMPNYVPSANYSDVVIANFRSYVNENFDGSPLKQYMFEWLDQMRAEYSDYIVASKLEQAAQQGLFPDRYAMYNVRAFMECIGDLTDLFDFNDDERDEILNWFSNALEEGELL